MIDQLSKSNQLSQKHKQQRDSARFERDSALEERDLARTEIDTMEKNSEAQEQFVATLSHDLRNPIGAIKMAVELLRTEITPQESKQMIDLIDRNANQAGELINQLLDVHLIKSGAKLPLNLEMCDLFLIVQKCVHSLAPQDQKKIVLDFESKKIEGCWDARALERALKNLLSNAIKFSDPEQDIKINVWQRLDVTGFSVQNFGQLISLENQLRIFESHFRLENVDAKKKGWGLGLTLIRGIAEAHNGKVEVTSSLAEGTIFTVKLPNNSKIC